MTIQRQKGFTLVEMIIYIVIIGILSASILLSFEKSLEANVSIGEEAKAINLAQGRMDLLIGQKKMVGFSSFSDICASSPYPAVCNILSGYTITSTITPNWDSNADYKLITVSVTGNASATLKSVVTSA